MPGITKFIKDGGVFRPFDYDSVDIHDVLPVGNYIVQQHPITKQLYFEVVDNFYNPKKLYGDTAERAARILNTFNDRPQTTGILLAGEKGSGKTLLAKVISAMAATNGIPTIIIGQPFCGDEFNKFIQNIMQPAIILFDEFEKVYKREDQEAILSLLDGVFPTKKLFILTCNDKWKINENMTNRPGRLFYLLEYEGLDCKFIEEYCADNLKDQQYTKAICNMSSTFDSFNFDILKALVEEMNRYNESPFEAVKMLNANPARDKDGRFTINLQIDGKPAKDPTYQWNETFNGNPIGLNHFKIHYEVPTGKENDDTDTECVEFESIHLMKIEPHVGRYTYDNGLGAVLVLTKILENSWNFSTYGAKFLA